MILVLLSTSTTTQFYTIYNKFWRNLQYHLIYNLHFAPSGVIGFSLTSKQISEELTVKLAWASYSAFLEEHSLCLQAGHLTFRNIEIFWHWPKTAKFDHIFDVFSGQGNRIELIHFALSQASWDTSLDYPQHTIPRTLKIHFFMVDPLLWDPYKYLLSDSLRSSELSTQGNL